MCLRCCGENNTIHVALRNGKRLQYVYNVRERDKNKTRRRGARCYSAVLISLIPTLWCSVPRWETPKLFFSSFIHDLRGILPCPLTAVLIVSLLSRYRSRTLSRSPHSFICHLINPVWYLAKLMHLWAITYLHKIYSAALGVWALASMFFMIKISSNYALKVVTSIWEINGRFI